MQQILSRSQVIVVIRSRESRNISEKSGGISIYFKECFSKYISKIETDSDYVLWIELSKNLFDSIDENIMLGAIYIPPLNPTSLMKMNFHCWTTR